MTENKEVGPYEWTLKDVVVGGIGVARDKIFDYGVSNVGLSKAAAARLDV